MNLHNDILESIGNTPMVKVNNIDTGKCDLFLKLENLNPGGSIKDRVGKSIIESAEENGLLKPGGTIIECTACLLYTSPSPRDKRQSRMPSSA